MKHRKVFSVMVLGGTLLSFSLIKCNNMNHWHSANVKGLMDMNEELNRMIFLNDSVGFLFGSNYSDAAVLNNRLRTQQNAIIYKTTDGGLTWHSTLNSGNGVFMDAINVKDTIFALKQVFYGEQVDQVKSIQLFNSLDQGDSWQKIGDVPGIVPRLCFCNSKIGFIISRVESKKSVKQVLYQTSDGGRNWQLIEKEHQGIDNVICSNNRTLFFLGTTSNDKISSNLLIQRDLISGNEHTEAIPFEAYVLSVDANKNLWLLGEQSGQVVLYRKSEAPEFNRIHAFTSEKRLTPYHLYVYDSTITVIVRESDIPKNAETGKMFPVGLTYKLFRSEDFGENWNEEKLPVNYLIKPFAFYGKERIWMNAGGGRLQWRVRD
jgi:hypothetical protein